MQLICRFFRNIIAESEGKELALRTLDRVYVHVPSAVRKAVGPDDLTQLQKVGSTDAMDETFFTALGRRGIRHFRFNVHESGFVGFAEADAGGERSIRGIGWVTGPDELIPRLREVT